MAEDRKRKTGIQRKLALIVFVSVLSIMVAGAGLIYFAGYGLLRDSIKKEYSQIANALSVYIKEALLNEIEDAKTYATRPLWIDFIDKANVKYGKIDEASARTGLLDMDKKWAESDSYSFMAREYLDNVVSISARAIVDIRKTTVEIIVADKFGGLVAASSKTSDFYQGDEEWWIEAYNSGKGNIYVGDIEFDESSGFWVMPISVPVMSKDNDVMGVCKVQISILRLFGGLENFKIGNTGHVVVADRNMNMLYYPGKPTMTAKYDPKVAGIFTASCRIDPPILSEKGVYWSIFLKQDSDETFASLNIFLIVLLVVTLIMIVLSIPLSYFAGRIFVKPIHQLHIATEAIIEGKWDHKINIRTNDEIEQLATAFKTMVSTIENKQAQLTAANASLEDLLRNMEEKVRERTKDLADTQEATLNILEDLQDAKVGLEESNKELFRLDQLKSDFVSTVSHELRTPLSIIKEGVSLVLDRITGDVNEKQAKVLATTKDNIDRLARIINSLLDISKIESGKLELKKEEIEVTALIRKVAASFESTIKGKGLAMELDVAGKEITCFADPDKMIQVLTNLIANAVKFTEKGRIKISCHDGDKEIQCSVSDTGVGISHQDVPKVFNKFQQFGRIAGPGEKGTGLGLSIAKGIIGLHGGRIWLESEQNKGSTFTFTLPKHSPENFFKDHIKAELGEAVRSNTPLSIIMISNIPSSCKDIEGNIARAFRDKADKVVRAGSEAVVALPGCNKINAFSVKERIEAELASYCKKNELDGYGGIKLGLSVYPDDASDEEGLLSKARTA